MKFLQQLDLRRQKRIAWWLLIAAIIIYILIMGTESVLRYMTYKATAFDLGNMDQVLWNTIHGRPFQFTNQAIDWYGPPNRLAVHVEPIMLVVSLLYLFHSDPRMLLIFQTLVLAAGAPAVFLLCRRYLPAWPLLAPVISIAYLASPALLGINIFDFHPDSLATPFFLYAILAVSNRRYAWFLILCFLACACKEDMPLAVALYGILLIWKYRLPRLGLTLFFGGILWTYIAFKIVIPHFYTGVQANNFWYRYEVYGSTPASAVINLLIHPWLIFTQILTLDRIYYVFSLLRSTGFLALLAPEWLLPALPKLASNFISTNEPNYSGVYHYNAAIIPFVILASIHGMRRLIFFWQSWSKKQFQPGEREVLAGLPAPDTACEAYPTQWIPGRVRALASYTWTALVRFFQRLKRFFVHLAKTLPFSSGPKRATLREWSQARWEDLGEHMFPFTKKVSTSRLQWVFCIWIIFALGLNYTLAIPQLNSFWPDHLPGTREAQIQQLLAMIPPDASVSASDDINPHLSERQWLQVFPEICLDRTCDHIVDYVIIDLDNPTIGANRADVISTYNDLQKKQYRLLKSAGNVALLQRRGIETQP